MATFLGSLRNLLGSITSLHKAAEKQDLAELRLQVQMHPSAVNAQEAKMGWTPLHVAADKGFDPGVRELLARGAKPNMQDQEGRTALHLAADRGHRKVVEDLLRRGASTSIRDQFGRTPYDNAVQRHPTIAALLGSTPPAPPQQQQQPLSPQPRSMPPVDLPSAASVTQLLPPPPAPIVRASPTPSGAFPRVYLGELPAEPLLTPPPVPVTSAADLSRLTAPYPAGPSAPDGYGAGVQVAPSPYRQAYVQGTQPHQAPTAFLPYPVVPSVRQQPGIESCPSDSGGGGTTHGPVLRGEPPPLPLHPPPPPPLPSPLSKFPLPPSLQSDSSVPQVWPRPPAPGAALESGTAGRGEGCGGCGGSGGGSSNAVGVEGTRGPVSAAGPEDLDWGGPSVPTDWGDEPDALVSLPSLPPSAFNRPNFNPIMSARVQLERLRDAGMSLLGIVPPRPGPYPAAATTAATSSLPHNNDLRGYNASVASTSSSIVSGASTTLMGGRTYSYEELQAATGNFNPLNKLGEGGYGPVYRGLLDCIPVAIKVMDTSEGCMQGRSEFESEVSILSSLHHPHLVLLIGSCRNRGILVYELMRNGSLETHLFGAGGGGTVTSPTPAAPASAAAAGGALRAASVGVPLGLSWRDRVRITAEVAAALLFLHTASTPIVHMDLKPANILLDAHLTAKLGDVGLARLAPTLARPAGRTATALHGAGGGIGGKSILLDSRLVGTFEYMDPEYVQTAQYSPRSDVYSLGMVMLQMLTGKQGQQIISQVEAERRDPLGFGPCIDPRAGTWPVAEAAAFADLALRCASASRQDRPDLRSVILPTLMQLKQRTQLYDQLPPPSQQLQLQQQQDTVPPMFLCPITQDIMDEPVVAADGYTYEKLAIAEWMRRSSTSPLTNLPLKDSNLVENRTLRSAIREWRERQQQQQAEQAKEENIAAAPAPPPPPPPPPRSVKRTDSGGW